jgi:hypothetical protein
MTPVVTPPCGTFTPVGIAILLVVLWHCSIVPVQHPSLWWRIFHRLASQAWSGVDLFFVLSGFLIGGILIDAKDSPSYFKALCSQVLPDSTPVCAHARGLLWGLGLRLRADIPAGRFPP